MRIETLEAISPEKDVQVMVIMCFPTADRRFLNGKDWEGLGSETPPGGVKSTSSLDSPPLSDPPGGGEPWRGGGGAGNALVREKPHCHEISLSWLSKHSTAQERYVSYSGLV